MKIVRAKKPYHPIAEILLLDEDEYRDDENDRERGQGRENWLQKLARRLEIAARRSFYDNRNRLGCSDLAG